MRGSWGFLFEVGLPGAILLAVVGSILSAIWRSFHNKSTQANPQTGERSRSSKRGKEWVGVVFLVLWTMLFGGYVLRVMRFHHDLWKLKASDVLAMHIGPQEFRDPTAIAAVVSDLHSSEWYSVNHGGWGNELPLELQLRSGNTWWMKIGYHFSQKGAVINRTSIDPTTKGSFIANEGYAFSSTLPQTLRQLGVPIPMCDTAHGRPCPPDPLQH